MKKIMYKMLISSRLTYIYKSILKIVCIYKRHDGGFNLQCLLKISC